MKRFTDAFMQGYNEGRRREPPSLLSVCDVLVLYSIFKCVLTPILASFHGTLTGYEAFLGGAIVAAALAFGEVYFRDRTDA